MIKILSIEKYMFIKLGFGNICCDLKFFDRLFIFVSDSIIVKVL